MASCQLSRVRTRLGECDAGRLERLRKRESASSSLGRSEGSRTERVARRGAIPRPQVALGGIHQVMRACATLLRRRIEANRGLPGVAAAGIVGDRLDSRSSCRRSWTISARVYRRATIQGGLRRWRSARCCSWTTWARRSERVVGRGALQAAGPPLPKWAADGTAVATNLAPDQLEPRIASWLQDRAVSWVYGMRGPDYRRSDVRAAGSGKAR
jgi:hypothetical protein